MSYNFIITELAAKKIKNLVETEKKEGLRLRISINGGGCSGFQYNFILDNKKEQDDQIFEKDGIEVIIDETSLALIEGAVLDYVEDMVASTFTLKNPNANASCGCGNSFSL